MIIRGWKIRIKFVRWDTWIGVYRERAFNKFYVCLVPCLPIIIERHRP